MRHVMFLLLRLTGVPFLLRELTQRNKVTILCYHDPDPVIVDAHFRLLSKHYTVISLRQYIDWRQGKHREALPPKALVVTFDDGHRNNYRLEELFERQNIRPTIFLCSSIVGTRRHFWWTAVRNRAMREDLKSMPDEERLKRLAKLGYEQEAEYPDRQTLSRDEIRQMRDVVDFQSHTRFHPILPLCSSERARDEISGSKYELEEKYDLSVYAIAFPNGDYSNREINLVKQAGYSCALILADGSNNMDADIYRLKRIPVMDSADRNELIVKVSGLWGLLRRGLGGQ